jgi:glutamate carboxypeptidase
MRNANYPKEFLRRLKLRLPEMLATLQRLVLAESPSLEKAPADRCCNLLAAEWRKRGARVERIAQKRRGDHLRVTWWPQKSRAAGQFLVLGHYDTVYSSGTLSKMPFRVTGGKAYGPGAFDMKAGIVQALFALKTLQETQAPLTRRLVFLWTSDEEIGSESSRKLIEADARRSDAVFVLEPALGPRGLIKTARKGVGEAELIVHGRASHAGLAPQEGINAIHELARQLARIQEWNDPRHGVTVNADLIEGGIRVNVIAERARAVLDLRALRIADMHRLERRLHALSPILHGARLEIRGGFNRAPPRTLIRRSAFAKAKELAAEMGLSRRMLRHGARTITSPCTRRRTRPCAVGHGAHSAREHILINTMPVRSALLAALLTNE